MAARDQFLFINGILTSPGAANEWTDRAVQWFNMNAPDGVVADKFEYYSPALLRRFFQRGHIDNLAEVIANYGGARLHLVGHSNGCELIAQALRYTSAPIASVHLIAGAVDRDFNTNGLSLRLLRGQVKRVVCYCSHGDNVLKYFARPSQIFGFLGLGYGDLGLRGPTGVQATAGCTVETYWRETYGHSDWFANEHFGETMNRIMHRALEPR